MTFVQTFFSYFQMPICEDFSVSYAQFSVANVASTIAGMLFSLTMATKICGGNTRLFMLIGGTVVAVVYVLQSYITAIWQLYVTFFILNFALCAITYIPINFLISQWFVDRKGLVTSIVLAGNGVGGMLFSGMMAKMIANQGWRTSFRATALFVIIPVIIGFLLIRKSPEEMGLEPYRETKKAATEAADQVAQAGPQWAGLTRGEAMKTTAFWFYLLCIVCCGIVAAGIFTQVPTYLTECGVDYAPVMAVFSAVTIFGLIVLGPIVDKLGISKGTALSAFIAIIAVVCLAMVNKFGAPAAYACMVIIPFGGAITNLAPPILTGQIFGYKDYGSIYGIGNFCFSLGCMVGPPLAASLRGITGSYFAAWVTMIIVYVVLGLAAVLAVKSGNRIDKTVA